MAKVAIKLGKSWKSEIRKRCNFTMESRAVVLCSISLHFYTLLSMGAWGQSLGLILVTDQIKYPFPKCHNTYMEITSDWDTGKNKTKLSFRMRYIYPGLSSWRGRKKSLSWESIAKSSHFIGSGPEFTLPTWLGRITTTSTQVKMWLKLAAANSDPFSLEDSSNTGL